MSSSTSTSTSTSTWAMLAAVDFNISLREATIKGLKKEIEFKTSDDPVYWETATKYALTVRSLTGLRLRRAVHRFVLGGHGPKAEFLESDEAQSFEKDMMAWETKERIYRKHMAELRDAKHTEANGQVPSTQPIFPPKFNVNNNVSRRYFKRNIARDQELRDPRGGMYVVFVLNIVTRKYEPGLYFTPFRLFAPKKGQELMTAIFGTPSQKVLFSPANALLLPLPLNKPFNDGLMAIVPDIEDLSSKDQIRSWMNSEPHEYKFKVFDDGRKDESGTPLLDCYAVGPYEECLSIRQLDGMRLQFPGCSPQSRPAARYLYFHYCCQLLRQAEKMRSEEGVETLPLPVWEKELQGMFAWGAVGKYFPDDQMRAFVEELGCGPEEWIDSGEEDKNGDSNEEEGDDDDWTFVELGEGI